MPRDPRENFSLDDEGSAWQGVSTWDERQKAATARAGKATTKILKIIKREKR